MDSPTKKPVCAVVTPVGLLGYGFTYRLVDEELTQLKHKDIPIAIILDAGSTDSGAGKLATGAYMTCSRSNYIRDLTKLIKLVVKHHVPLIISSAGGDGSSDHVDTLVKIIQEAFAKMDSSKELKIISIYSEISRELVLKRLEEGRIAGCGSAVPKLTPEAIAATPRIVAQMGHEPFLDAMFANEDFSVIMGGRAYDPAIYVSFASFCYLKARNADRSALDERVLGNFYAAGQALECGGSSGSPKSAAAVAVIYDDCFDVYPLQAGSRCTPMSVAAHMMYEKSRPDLLFGPGGYVDLTRINYEQVIDMKTVRVSGAIFKKGRLSDGKYDVKLEGGIIAGYRSIFIGSFGHPLIIAQLDDFLRRIHVYVEQQFHDVEASWKLHFHHYGDGPGPICIIGEALADTQALAASVINTARIAATHGPVHGIASASGNLGMGIGGNPETDTGPCAVFSVYHVMELEEGEERGAADDSTASKSLFRWKIDIAKSEGHASTGLLGLENLADPPKTPTLRSDPLPMTFERLSGVAQVIRSKNSGPYAWTVEVLFEEPWCYKLIKESDLLSRATMCQVFALNDEDIEYLGYFDQAKAFKATFPRRREGKLVPSGGFMENDVHGSQKYLPLLNLELPASLSKQLEAAFKTFQESDRIDGDDDVAEASEGITELRVRDTEVDIPALRIIRSSVSA